MNKVDLPGAEPERVGEEIAELIGENPDEVRRISAKTGEGVNDAARADRPARPAAVGRPEGLAARADLRLRVRPVPRRDRLHPRRRRHVPQGRDDHRHADRDAGRDRRHRLLHAHAQLPSDTLSAGEVGYLITGIKDVSQLAVGDTLTTKNHQATEPLPGYRDVKPMVFCGLFPMNNDDYPELRDALEKLTLNDAALELGAGDLRRARLRLPLRLPRPAAHGHRARAPGARVRPRADGDDAERRVRDHAHRRLGDPGPQPDRHARPGAHRRGPRALHPRLDPDAQGVHRADHGALPAAPRQPLGDALPVLRARPADLRPAAGGDRARLLRPAQDAHQGLRVAGLRAGRPAPLEPGQARRPARRRHRRRALAWSCTATRPTSRASR